MRIDSDLGLMTVSINQKGPSLDHTMKVSPSEDK